MLSLMIVANWMLRQGDVSSLIMEMSSLATDFGMIRIERSLGVGMWSLMRKCLYKDKYSGDLKGTVQENSKFVSLDIPEYIPQDQ